MHLHKATTICKQLRQLQIATKQLSTTTDRHKYLRIATESTERHR